jgi:hypothetical protein
VERIRSGCVAGVFSLVVHGIEGDAMVLVACMRMPPTMEAFVVPSTSPSNGGHIVLCMQMMVRSTFVFGSSMFKMVPAEGGEEEGSSQLFGVLAC